MVSSINVNQTGGYMDALFLIGQVVWIAILACGAYVSFCFYDLADENAARTAKPMRSAQESPPAASSPPGEGVLT
jgi:hypothetical protein